MQLWLLVSKVYFNTKNITDSPKYLECSIIHERVYFVTDLLSRNLQNILLITKLSDIWQQYKESIDMLTYPFWKEYTTAFCIPAIFWWITMLLKKHAQCQNDSWWPCKFRIFQ